MRVGTNQNDWEIMKRYTYKAFIGLYTAQVTKVMGGKCSVPQWGTLAVSSEWKISFFLCLSLHRNWWGRNVCSKVRTFLTFAKFHCGAGWRWQTHGIRWKMHSFVVLVTVKWEIIKNRCAETFRNLLCLVWLIRILIKPCTDTDGVRPNCLLQ